jgi:hypothetical protein
MSHFLKRYLATTGIGAALAVFFPSLVVIGFFLFILPGMILGLMPLAFLYGLAFTILWLPLQLVTGPRLASAIAVPAIIAFFWFVATPGHEQGLARLATVTLPDISPSKPIALSGDVRIAVQLANFESIRRDTGATSHIVCDGVCAATLFTPGVRSVTLTSWERTHKPQGYVYGGEQLTSSARTFRLLPLEECTATAEAPDLSALDAGLAAELRLGLSKTSCLVSEAPIHSFDLQLTVGGYWVFNEETSSPDWSLKPNNVWVDRLEYVILNAMCCFGGWLLIS